MAVKRGKTVDPIRKTSKVGPSYDESRYDNPWGADMDGAEGDGDDKAIRTENRTTFDGGGAPLEKGRYDDLWRGK